MFENILLFHQMANKLRYVELHLPICLPIYSFGKHFSEQVLNTLMFHSGGILLTLQLFSHLFIHSEKVTSFEMKQVWV